MLPLWSYSIPFSVYLFVGFQLPPTFSRKAAEVRKIEGYVRTYSDFDITAYTNSGELARDIADGAVFDLYLLDIVMPETDGIELARIIRRADKTAAIIFLTSHDAHAREAFHVRAAQYLSKPVNFETLRSELDIAITTVKERAAKTFILKTSTGTMAIPFHRIAYCELEGRSLICVTADGERHRSVTLRGAFDEAVTELMADARFLRPHMSYVVNMDYAGSIQGQSMIMNSGVHIPITHGNLKAIKGKYSDYFFNSKEAGGDDA